MANAKICDRCGKIYLKQDKSKRYSVFDADYFGHKVGAPMDLCSDCAEYLTAWVEAWIERSVEQNEIDR